MALSIPLTLRTIKGSKLTFNELDANFLNLRSAINSVSNTDTFVTGGTYNPSTLEIEFLGNTGFNPFSVDVSKLIDTYVSSGVYDQGTGCVTFTTTSGYTFDVCGFLTGSTLWVNGSAGNYSLKTINDSGLDATGNYALAEGFNTTASGNYSHAEGQETQATGITSHAEGRLTKAHGDYSHAEGWGNLASGFGSHAEGEETTASNTDAHAEGFNTTASGQGSHAEGYGGKFGILASGQGSHAEGNSTLASGDASHAEGIYTTASGQQSHAEGGNTMAIGVSSHAEGSGTIAQGDISHAEGENTTAIGYTSHAEGQFTQATGQTAHSEGYQTKAHGDHSHAEGFNTIAIGQASHAQNYQTTASGPYSTASGYYSTASGYYSTASGSYTLASGDASHAEGLSTIASGPSSHAEGFNTLAQGTRSHAEGSNTTASGDYSHAEGFGGKGGGIASGTASHSEGISTIASGDGSHAEGNITTASGGQSHAEGQSTTASGQQSHAEGFGTIASGSFSHSEGRDTTASGVYSHAEGFNTTASGKPSHAEGANTTAIGVSSHAEGGNTIAIGQASHSEGRFTIASGDYSHAGGYNSVVSGTTSFIHSTNSILTGDRSVLLGGQNLTGTTNDTVYVPFLNINNLGVGTSINNLGIDASGNVVTGSDQTNLGNILYVSQNGDDSSAQKGNLHKPWRNLYSAKSASTSGDTVYVLPGTWTYDNSSLFYNGQVDTLVNLWKDGVTYYFSPNTKIELINIGGVASDSMYLFSPKGTTGETCTVLGHLDFEQTSSGANSGGHNYFYYNNEPAFSTDGSTFYAEVKKLTSHHSPILGFEGDTTSINQTNLTIISEEEYHDYVGGNSAAGSFYFIRNAGGASISNNINLYSKYRYYNGVTPNIGYGFYLRQDCTNTNINISGERVFCNTALIYQLFPKGEFNINIKDIHYGTLTPAGLSGVVLISYPLNSTDEWTLNLNGNLYDDAPNSSTKGLFSMFSNSFNGTVNYKGNITTNTSSGNGRFIVNTGNNANNIKVNIDGDITYIGTGTTTTGIFQNNGTTNVNTVINYTGKITGNFASPIARPRSGGVININNSFIESEIDGSTSSIFTNDSTSLGTGRLNNSYVRLTNNTNGVIDGEDNNIFINNSNVVNLGTGSTIAYNTTNNGDLQIVNSTLISSFSGATGILYNGSTNVISSNTTVSNSNNINNLLGNIIVLTDLTT